MAKHQYGGVKIPKPTPVRGDKSSPIAPTHKGWSGGPGAGSVKRSDQEGKKK